MINKAYFQPRLVIVDQRLDKSGILKTVSCSASFQYYYTLEIQTKSCFSVTLIMILWYLETRGNYDRCDEDEWPIFLVVTRGK